MVDCLIVDMQEAAKYVTENDEEDDIARLMSKLLVEGLKTSEIENYLVELSDAEQVRAQHGLIVEHCERGLFRKFLLS